MTTQEFKKFIKASKGIKYVSNNISGETNYVEVEAGLGLKKLGINKTHRRIFTPNTKGSFNSDWSLCIQDKIGGYEVNFWFSIRLFDNGEFNYFLTHGYKPGNGKNLRRDAKWNWEMKIKEKAGFYEEIEIPDCSPAGERI